MSDLRRLVYRFVALPWNPRVVIGQKLDLLHDDELRLSSKDLVTTVFERAKQDNKLDALSEAIAEYEPSPKSSESPFTTPEIEPVGKSLWEKDVLIPQENDPDPLPLKDGR